MYGIKHYCNHPIYNVCTLYLIDNKGLAVIQQRFDSDTKHTYWTDIDPWLANDIYINPKFLEYFEEKANCPKTDIYPTVTVRQIMYALHIKPLLKEFWETAFDHKI